MDDLNKIFEEGGKEPTEEDVGKMMKAFVDQFERMSWALTLTLEIFKSLLVCPDVFALAGVWKVEHQNNVLRRSVSALLKGLWTEESIHVFCCKTGS